MSEFDWEVGDDGFEESYTVDTRDIDRLVPIDMAPVEQKRARPSRRLRRVLFVVAPLLLIALVAVLLTQRVDDASITQRDDVVAVYDLFQQARAHADSELYTSLISARDSRWGRTQRELFDAGLMFDRRSLGLTFRSDVSPRIIDVQLSNDLHEADVSAEFKYLVDQGNGATTEVGLIHTTHFQSAGQRWRQASPPSSFWGEEIHYRTPLIRITYPERDRDTGQRLAYELDQMLGEFCQSFTGRACPSGMQIDLELGTNPLLLSAIAQPVAPLSLVVDPEGQTRFPLRISLPAPTLVGVPLDEAGYIALYRGYGTHIAQQLAVALSRDDSRRLGYSQLMQSTLTKALVEVGVHPWPPVAPQSGSPIALPEQDLLVLCASDLAGGGSIQRYDVTHDLWTSLWPDRTIVALYQNPHSNEIRLDEQSNIAGEKYLRPLTLRNGELIEGAAPEVAALSETIDSPDASQAIIAINRTRLQGSNLIRRASDGSESEISAGYSPFWLDDQTYGFVELFGQRVLIASTADDVPRTLIDMDRLSAVLSDDLRTNPLTQLSISEAIPSRNDSDLMLIRLYGYDVNSGHLGLFTIRGYILSYNLRTDQLEIRIGYRNLIGVPTPSPDQLWLAAETQEKLGGKTTILAHDIEHNQTHIFPIFPTYTASARWSSDGQWLLAMSDGVLSLIAPQHDVQLNIVPDQPGCATAVWLDRK